ncbi:MAG TPA: hypothetical protein DD861_05820 [Erythrobacter sp.]|nr:hypothetical protein [Erythrobacter sp.]
MAVLGQNFEDHFSPLANKFPSFRRYGFRAFGDLQECITDREEFGACGEVRQRAACLGKQNATDVGGFCLTLACRSCLNRLRFAFR